MMIVGSIMTLGSMATMYRLYRMDPDSRERLRREARHKSTTGLPAELEKELE